MRRVPARSCAIVVLCTVLAAACAPRAHLEAERAVLRAALLELFASREHAQAITLWQDARLHAPTLSVYGGPWDAHDTLAVARVDAAELALPFRVEHTSLREMSDFFARHPGGWDRWFEHHPGNAGIVEVVTPRLFADSAVVTVGRACGEMCRTAWRVSLVRSGDAWQVRQVQVHRLPR